MSRALRTAILVATLPAAACTTSEAPNEPPVARLTAPVLADARQPVTLDGTASTDTDGTLSRYTFSFGDGSPETAFIESSVRHVFVGAGRFTVRLTVMDDDGATSTVTQDITLVDRFTPPYCASDVDCDVAATDRCVADAGVCFRTTEDAR